MDPSLYACCALAKGGVCATTMTFVCHSWVRAFGGWHKGGAGGVPSWWGWVHLAVGTRGGGVGARGGLVVGVPMAQARGGQNRGGQKQGRRRPSINHPGHHAEQGTWGSRTRKHREAGCGRPEDGGVWTAKPVKRPLQQPVRP